MYRSLFVTLALAFLLVGCAQPQVSMEPPKKPDPAPEMAQLDRFIGAWSDTFEIVEPSPEQMMKGKPEGETPSQSSAAGYTWSKTLDGMYMQIRGWHEMGPDQRMNFHEYITWDAKAKKFHSWSFSDYGERGEGWMTVAADGKTFEWTGAGVDADGKASKGHGTMTFLDENTIEWTWAESGPKGKMKFKGTSKRRT